ncbi:MAG: adenosylcobalamin-dependent ribonucleoside-diphosphate reductase [Dissulfurispiraceae bacterium]
MTVVADKQDNIQTVMDYIWSEKYRSGEEKNLSETIARFVEPVARVEADFERWNTEFIKLTDVFFTGGRIANSLGTKKTKTTAMNCFVSRAISDSMVGILQAEWDATLTMQAGGGVGYDFSTLRPKGAKVKGVGATSSGPLSFMKVFDAMCETIKSSGHRRGAQMAVLRVDHPDIEDFITAKRGSDNKSFQNFNFSVAVTDDFIRAVKENSEWNLVFGGQVYKTVNARSLWDQIMANNYDYAEPGVLFIDRINRMNNLAPFGEVICATNPCGEQPLPPFGACCLGSLNLTKFVINPFADDARFDVEFLKGRVAVAVRFLDDVLTVANMPIPEQKEEVENKRRIGLGVTGVGDMLWMLGMQYGSPEAVTFCEDLAREMMVAAYRASVELAKEKGPFKIFDAHKYLSGEFVKNLPEDLQNDIRTYGIRNSHLLTIAPTGTTSLLQGNISSGVEPILHLVAERKILEADGKEKKVVIDDYAYRIWKEKFGDAEPKVLVSSQISAKGHIDVMSAFQKYFDASISKTIIFDPNTSFEEFKDTYNYAHSKGVKGCTVYRESGKLDEVIKAKGDGYLKPMKLPDSRHKISEKVETPEGDMYVDVTVVDGKPREIWVVTPVEAARPEDLDAICKLASISLRCNVDPESVLKQMTTSIRKYGHVSSMLSFVERGCRRALAKIDGAKAVEIKGEACPDCGGMLVREAGCTHCTACIYEKC